MMTVLRGWVLLCFALGLAKGLAAQSPADWVGKQVVVVVPEADLEASGVKLGKASEGTVLNVDKVNDDWLWIASHSAYIHASEVKPMDQALEYYAKELKAKPNAGKYIMRARLYRTQGKYDLALQDTAEAIRLEPGRLEWLVFQGILLHDGKQYDRAIEVCNEAVKRLSTLDKNTMMPDLDLSGRGTTQMVPASALILNNRGWAFSEKGDFDKAIADFNRALQFRPDFARALFNRGVTWERKEEFDQAIADYSAVLKAFPSNSKVLANRGRAWYFKGDYAKAIADCDTALKAQARMPQAIATRRASLELLERWDDISKELESDAQAIGDFASRNTLAWFLATCPDPSHRNGARAVELSEANAKETERKNANVLDTLAASYAEMGAFEKAIAAEEEAIGLSADDMKEEFQQRLKLFQGKESYHAKRMPPKLGKVR